MTINPSNDQEFTKPFVTELQNQLSAVFERKDLLKAISDTLNTHYYFTSIEIQLVEFHTGTYFPFLIQQLANAGSHASFKALTNTRKSLEDVIIKDAVLKEDCFVITAKDIEQLKDVPYWIKTNFEFGAKELLISPLKVKDDTLGLLFIWSDQPESFCDCFRNLINVLSPEIGYAQYSMVVNEVLGLHDWMNEAVLSLSKKLVAAKNLMGLMMVLKDGLLKSFHFTDCIIAIKKCSDHYYRLLSSEPNLLENDFIEYPVNDGVYNLHAANESSAVVHVEDFDMTSGPKWLQNIHAYGGREMMIAMLPSDGVYQFSLLLVADQVNNFEPADRQIVARTSGHLATTISNLLATEEIISREQDQSFLLEFSRLLATVRTNEDLSIVMSKELAKLAFIRIYGIRMINDDRQSLSTYVFDKHAAGLTEDEMEQILNFKDPIDDGVADVVLASKDPVIFNISDMIAAGTAPKYFEAWKAMKFQIDTVAGTPLRNGDFNLGIFWVTLDENQQINIRLLNGIASQLAIAMANIFANGELINYRERLEVENKHLRDQIKTFYSSNIIGTSNAIQEVFELVNTVAHSNATVLLCGETGTGKEVIARAIHESSPRKNKLMIKVNCAAIPPNLIESELFGHEKGSFTGAHERRVGKFELANGSTLFLDEIGELPLDQQVKLLRVIQEREFERVGGRTTIKVDVRIIAATNRDLQAEVDAGRFRSDLYYRLSVFPILLPPLRDRKEDIPLLAEYFLAKYSKFSIQKVNAISKKAIADLKQYNWPGNVRELEHMIERSVLLCDGKILKKVHLPVAHNREAVLRESSFQENEKNHIAEILKQCGGKISGKGGAAELLNLPPSTLNSKIKKLGLTKNVTSE
jgi:formate hydrogenlyase transcriptional activator